MEEWRPVLGFEDSYEISSVGRVRSLPRRDARGWQRKGRTLRPSRDGSGYQQVVLYLGGPHCRKIHTLICEAWNGPRPQGSQVRHLDGDQLNNTPANLRWGTAGENVQDTVAHGTHSNTRKTHCPNGHRYGSVRSGRRRCRICENANARVRYAMLRALPEAIR